jgi:hypothetical protein
LLISSGDDRALAEQLRDDRGGLPSASQIERWANGAVLRPAAANDPFGQKPWLKLVIPDD